MSDTKAPPTPTRLRKLRSEGTLPVGTLFPQGIGVCVLIALVYLNGAALLEPMQEILRAAGDSPSQAFPQIQDVVLRIGRILLLSGGSAWLTSILQRRGHLQFPKPSLKRFRPFSGLLARFQREALVSFGAQCLVAFPLAYFLVRQIPGRLDTLATIAHSPESARDLLPSAIPALLRSPAKALLLLSVLAGGLDALLRWRSFLERHGMSRHELKEEHRNQEGSPENRAAIHQRRMELMASPPAKAMQLADVVIRNPTHLCVAIAEANSAAPWVLMTGEGPRARQLLRLAERYECPSLRSVPLARALHACGEGADVPPQLIAAVAEAARWAHEDRRARQSSM